ncbi:MAG TPA: chemotaxis protein CheB [Acetobacteraceae bacterium]
MTKRDIIVIGGSAGALPPLVELAAALPGDFPGVLLVVLHIGPRPSNLPEILNRFGQLPAFFPSDGEALQPGRIYVAPPDRHLLVGPGHVHISRGPRENRTRPAIDPLFRSAAQFYGPRVAGVVLSGMLADGTAGLGEIRRRGGTTVVQDPADAEFSGMPRTALRHVPVDHCVPARTMAALLTEMAAHPPAERGRTAASPITAQEGLNMPSGYTMDPPTALICPDCGGAVREETADSLPYFICHIGHRFAAADMDEAEFRATERALESALRTLSERAAFCDRMMQAMQAKGWDRSARDWTAARAQAEERAQVIRGMLEADWLRPDPDGDGISPK